MNSVSVIILTFNEEKNITAAIDSAINWADEIFVVDSYSTDNTVDLVLQRTEKNVHIVQHTFENFSSQWNWALSNLPLKGKWTLKLDADERLTDEFKKEVTTKVLNKNDIEGAYFKRKFFFMGTPLTHSGFSNTYVMHLWQTGKAKFEDRPINEHPIIEGEAIRLNSSINHFDFKSLTDWISKHNRYSSMEARCQINGNWTGDIAPKLFGNSDERRMWIKSVYKKLPLRHFLYFFSRLIIQKTILDGIPGIRYTLLHTTYRYWIDLKVLEYKNTEKLPHVEWPERGAPHPTLLKNNLCYE